jgi:hypothetical protein
MKLACHQSLLSYLGNVTDARLFENIVDAIQVKRLSLSKKSSTSILSDIKTKHKKSLQMCYYCLE